MATVTSDAHLLQKAGKTGLPSKRETADQAAIAVCPEVRLPERAGGWKKKLKADYRPGTIDLSCYRFLDHPRAAGASTGTSGTGTSGTGTSGTGGTSAPLPTAYELAVGDKNYRNRLAAILIKQSDDVCTSEKALLHKHQAELNGWLSVLTSAFSGASTVVTGELAKSILSATAGLTNSTRDHVNTHVYRNQIIQTITQAIDSERNTLRSAMTTHFHEDTDSYPADVMIRDVNAYHQACSFEHGLQIVMEAVEKREDYIQGKKAQTIKDEVQRLLYTPEVKDLQSSKDAINRLQNEYIKLVTGVDVSASVDTADTRPDTGSAQPQQDDAPSTDGDGGGG